MRQILDSVWDFLVCMGRARAYGVLVRQGMYKEARALLFRESKT